MQFMLSPLKKLGPDGFPGDWYKMYIVDLAPRLQLLYATCLKEKQLPDSLSQAHIVLILKPGKDTTYCSAYRTISLFKLGLENLNENPCYRIDENPPVFSEY